MSTVPKQRYMPDSQMHPLNICLSQDLCVFLVLKIDGLLWNDNSDSDVKSSAVFVPTTFVHRIMPPLRLSSIRVMHTFKEWDQDWAFHADV